MSSLTETVIYLGLGSNLGDRGAYLRAALAALRELTRVDAVSRVYESEPVGLLPQPDYWNLVIRARTTLEPLELLSHLKQIEVALGRGPAARNAPRIIDIDLLAYGQRVQHDLALDLPHPRMHERTFVLYPLAELAPEFRHPESGRSLPELLAQLALPTRAVPLDGFVLENGE
ncbi:MAG: 2-amino-4-hydroxy-6-hydroxymethyldihydropteridine diphosphokinase [Longimicrobiales bacterium]